MAFESISPGDAFKLGVLASVPGCPAALPPRPRRASRWPAVDPSPRMTLRERLREKISAAFYRHGLLCASYPVPIILFTSASILTCCYPLLRLPLPGTGPVEFTTGGRDYSVLVKAAVSPWDSSLVPVDVFRSPLSRAFSLLEEIRNHVHSDGSGVRSLESLCLQVTDLFPGLRRMQSVLPEHGCLLVSPGNYWQNQQELFDSDPDLLKTIQKHEPKGLSTSATLRDLLFGVPGKYTGVSHYNRKRVVTYTITIVLSTYDARFLGSLRSRLKQLHPSANCSLRDDHMVHVHFKEEIGIAELIPLIDMVKSKWGLALAAVVTVLSSLLMSVGLCTLFGLTPTLNGGEIFPYLVVVIGLENVLVLTKSVVSTPVDLEVKLRIAQAGLPPPKPGPLRPREAPPPPRPSPHTITLQTPAFRNLRLPKRLRVSEQSPLGDPGGGALPPHLGGAPVFRGVDPTSTLSIHPAPDPTPLPDNHSQGHHDGAGRAGPLPQPPPPAVPQITWGPEDQEGWRRLSFRHWPSLFSYYNITLAKRYISILPVIPDIECLASDGMLLASCCLAGQIRVWDAQTGDCLTVIPRQGLKRSSSSSGFWDQRDGWDGVGGASDDGLSEEDGFPLRRRSAPSRPTLFTDQPDLTPLIDTNFASQPPSHLCTPPPSHLCTPPRDGFDFGGLVERAYIEHEPPSSSTYPSATSASSSPPSGVPLQRRPSGGDASASLTPERGSAAGTQATADWESSLWDAVEGSLRCVNEDGGSGITALAFLNNRIVAARLNGSLDFFTVEINKPLGLLQYRGAPGRGTMPPSPCYSSEDVISCQLTRSVQCAHQKPITIYRLEDSCCLFTLQAICLWDVLTGSRVSHVYGHRGDVTSLVCTTSCVISSGLDDLICIWDRSTGIKLRRAAGQSGVISESLLVTGGAGLRLLLDLNFGDCCRRCIWARAATGRASQLLVLDNAAIICDFGGRAQPGLCRSTACQEELRSYKCVCVCVCVCVCLNE
ncbi:hypothetical protein F7725_017925 [Dissostichus mawsoni]|uniref:Sterol regulatory element-binding protein cleavage-activating protein n=1 Tax=Dissostichus mawsoni TaxID=36200 RepID=A0A7J5XSY3_DISMA|nr:hypothetical protein F7725_017925 [Dissostichus mawsoni]